MKKLKVLELFGGIGACSKALEKLGIDYEIADYVEIDKYAVKSFNAIHNTNFEPQDITQWDKQIDVDLIMHGSPCQDFSLAGLQAGGDEGSGTRSSLMYETIRIVKKLKPKYVIWENVKNLLSKKHRHNFDSYLEIMESLGYANYYQVLNAKDYGIPQNRERVFTISILKEKIIYDDYNSNIRKDQDTIGTLTTNCGSSTTRNGWKIIEKNKNFVFPPKQELKLKLKDMLENNVDEKYYLSDKMIKYISDNNEKWTGNNKESLINKSIASTINTGEGSRRCDASNYICNNLPNNYNLKETCLVKNQGTKITKLTNICNTLLARDYKGLGNQEMSAVIEKTKPLKIRRLTPKECWRLMGFDDEDFDKASRVNSNSQLYKQAGNSIVVNVLEAIFRNLFMEEL